MRNILMALVVTGFAGAGQLRADDKLTPTMLEGNYRITKGQEYGGKKPKDNVKDTIVKIAKGKITTYDTDHKETYVANYKLDASATPCKIMMVAVKPKEGVEANGLIKKVGDTVTLIYALPGGEMPSEFKTGDKQLMFTMTKVTDSDPAKKKADKMKK